MSNPIMYGPKRISDQRQVALPKELMEEQGLEIGDAIYMLSWGRRILIVHQDDAGPKLRQLWSEMAAPEPRQRRRA